MEKMKTDKIKTDLFLVNPESRAVLLGERKPSFNIGAYALWFLGIFIGLWLSYMAFTNLLDQIDIWRTLRDEGVTTPMQITSLWRSSDDEYRVSYALNDPAAQFSHSGTQTISEDAYNALQGAEMVDILHLPGAFTESGLAGWHAGGFQYVDVARDFGFPIGQLRTTLLFVGGTFALMGYTAYKMRKDWLFSHQGELVYGQIIDIPQIVNNTFTLYYVFTSPQTGHPIEASTAVFVKTKLWPHVGMHIAVQYTDDNTYRLL